MRDFVSSLAPLNPIASAEVLYQPLSSLATVASTEGLHQPLIALDSTPIDNSSIACSPSDTIENVKQNTVRRANLARSASSQIWGKKIKDSRSLSDYNIQKN